MLNLPQILSAGRALFATVLIAATIAALPVGALAQNDPVSPTRADQIADLLVRIDRAADAPSRKARKLLARDLATLDRLGVRALPEAEDGAIDGWRQLAGATRVPPNRGRILGPAYRRGWIEPRGQLQVEQLFLSGQTATVSLAATPDQPVRLAVTGPDAAGICPSAGRNCKWMPLFTQRYTITIRNNGAQRTRFYLVVD